MTRADSIKRSIRVQCFSCGEVHDPANLLNACLKCNLPLAVLLDLPRSDPEELILGSEESMWRYRAVLPVPYENRVSMGEGWTPVFEVNPNVWVKNEAVNPTGSFKDRGMSMAVSAARLRGARRLVAPSAGNAAVALAGYGRKAGIPVAVAMPTDTPAEFVDRCTDLGAEVNLVSGDISVAGRWLKEHRSPGDYDLSTLREPYRVEGKKTMGYELFEQFDGRLPDVIIYPTGGGTGLVGMWKAFDEMESMGWIGPIRPRLVSVQAQGCAPVVRAFREGESDIEPWSEPETTAWGLRVPSPIAGFLCLRAIKETRGVAIAVAEEDLHDAAARASEETGIDFCPEGGAAWAAAEHLVSSGWVSTSERVLVWNTGSGASYQ